MNTVQAIARFPRRFAYISLARSLVARARVVLSPIATQWMQDAVRESDAAFEDI
jgi:hypothetical protein